MVEPSQPCTAYTFLLVAEGYTKSEESRFDADAQAMLAKLEAIPGFAENWKYVAVYRKFFTSVDSGLSDAATGTVRDTAFRVEHAHDPNDPAMHRQIWMRDDLPAETLAKLDAARTETHSDVVLMPANTSEWAGTASAQVRIGIFAANPDVARIAGHEIGHALWDLEAKGWTEECVAEAKKTVGICRGVCADGVSACAHDECTEGAALNESCSTCAAAVCERDSDCCSDTGKWDWICASEAERDPYCECP